LEGRIFDFEIDFERQELRKGRDTSRILLKLAHAQLKYVELRRLSARHVETILSESFHFIQTSFSSHKLLTDRAFAILMV